MVYAKSIQNSPASLQVAPPTSLDNTFEMKASSAVFTVDPENAVALYYSDGSYSAATSMKIILRVCMIVALVNLVIGVGFWKLVGIEATHVIQILFLASSLITSLPPAMAPATEVWPSLGYNKLFTDFPDLFGFDSPDMPKTLVQMGVGARFVQNCNYMLAGQFLVLLVGGLLFFLSRAITKYNEGLLLAAKYVLNEVFMVLVLFNCLNVGFSLGLHILYWDRPSAQSLVSQIINLAPAATVFAMAAIHFYMMYKRNEYFSHNNRMFKQDKLSRCHPIIMYLVRSLMGATLAALNEFQYGIIAPGAIQLIYLIYVLFKRPYKKTVVSIRAIVNESVVGVVFAVAVVYNLDMIDA